MGNPAIYGEDNVNAKEAARRLGLTPNQVGDLLERGMIVGAYRPYRGMEWIIPTPIQLRERPFMQAAEACELLNRKRATLPYYRDKGWLNPVKARVGRQELWLYPRDEVMALKEQLEAKDDKRKVSGPKPRGDN